MLTVHMGSVNWNDLPSIRNFLECHEYGKHSFAALTDGKGSGPRAARSARVQEAFPTEGEGAPVDVDVLPMPPRRRGLADHAVCGVRRAGDEGRTRCPHGWATLRLSRLSTRR